MKLEMAKNSLFAILLRSPWWMSAGIAMAVAALAYLVLPSAYAPYGAFGATPFLVIAAIAGWKALRAPSATRVAAALERVGGMSWNEFSTVLEQAFRDEGYAVRRLALPQADFELTREARVTLVSCKRWKVARTGVEPLRSLSEAAQAREAHESMYVAAGEFTDNATTFAAAKRIRLVHGADLARMLPGAGRAKTT